MKKDQATHDKLKLRKRAEDELQGEPEDISDMSEEEMRHHIQELRIHQIELDMQNEELLRAQLELEAARDKYSDLYDFAPVGYFTISAKGMILEANLTGADMLGVTRGVLIGSPFSTFIKRDDQDIYYNRRMKLIETKSKQILVMRLVKKDGSQFHVRIECTPVLDEAGNFHHIRAVVSDISDWKRAEEEKARIETHLKQAQKMEAIASLAGGVAHQFNNSLTPVIGYLDLLVMEYPDDEKINNYAEQMRDSANWMASLTDQLLAYARGGNYQVQIVSLSDFVKDTLPLIEHTLKPSISVETDFPRNIFNVKADLPQMQMALSAILSNGSEAIEGRGRIRITCQNEIITDEKAKYLQGLKPGIYVKLQIEDDGMGMDEKTKSRIFEPFFTTKFLGRGLGMAAAYGIIRNHDGQISVDSESGQGTTVQIYLPATEKKAKEPK
ncbi:ATP-binding protein [Desulfococcaceae bacterium HSG9]|nr:ATP-binding protein [Desulfococcaceae bacterium HSG9]